MVQSNPLVAAGVPVADFSGTVTRRRRRATVTAGQEQVVLNARGAKLVGELLTASPDLVTAVEKLLESTRAASSPGRQGMVSPEEAAGILGVSRPTVVRWASEGLLTDHRVGSHHRFDRDEVTRLRDDRQAEARQARMGAAKSRQSLLDEGVDLDVPPTPAEMVAAGVAARKGDRRSAASVLARQRRQDARSAAAAAGSTEES